MAETTGCVFHSAQAFEKTRRKLAKHNQLCFAGQIDKAMTATNAIEAIEALTAIPDLMSNFHSDPQHLKSIERS